MRTLQSELVKKGFKTKQTESSPSNKPRKKKEEKLTDREWRELMGMNRDRYQRVGGAFRRR
ncbi:hypothetical protein ABZ756_13690 [Mammaliicoccus sciuri]